MTFQQTYQIFQSKQKLNFIITACVLVLVCANVMLDFSDTLFQHSSFYISESLLFSSYWFLFLPLVTFILKQTKEVKKQKIKVLLIGSTTAFHLLIYPALVWIVSKIFYQHTFDYWQTFNFGLSAYFIKTVIIYGFSVYAFTLLGKKNETELEEEVVEEKTSKNNFIASILVTDSNNKKLVLQLHDVSYFSANPPYIDIYHSSKKYLHSETLKSLQAKMDDKQFVRIHKSHIVNINKIASIQSRQNGDYDITLLDNTILRVSRNYASRFKSAFGLYTQLTSK